MDRESSYIIKGQRESLLVTIRGKKLTMPLTIYAFNLFQCLTHISGKTLKGYWESSRRFYSNFITTQPSNSTLPTFSLPCYNPWLPSYVFKGEARPLLLWKWHLGSGSCGWANASFLKPWVGTETKCLLVQTKLLLTFPKITILSIHIDILSFCIFLYLIVVWIPPMSCVFEYIQHIC